MEGKSKRELTGEATRGLRHFCVRVCAFFGPIGFCRMGNYISGGSAACLGIARAETNSMYAGRDTGVEHCVKETWKTTRKQAKVLWS